MNHETENNQLNNTEHEKNHHEPRPYWKRAHLHWAFWVGVVCMAIALLVYIFSVDLALVPRSWHQQTLPAATSK